MLMITMGESTVVPAGNQQPPIAPAPGGDVAFQAMIAQTIATTMAMVNPPRPMAPPPPTKKKAPEGTTYSRFKLAVLMGYSGVTQPQHLPRIWSLFTLTKDVDTHRINIMSAMTKWAAAHGKRIDKNVFLPKECVEDWVKVRMIPGESITIYQTAGKGISPLALMPYTPIELHAA